MTRKELKARKKEMRRYKIDITKLKLGKQKTKKEIIKKSKHRNRIKKSKYE